MRRMQRALFDFYHVITRRGKQRLILLIDIVVAPLAFAVTCLFTYGQDLLSEAARLAILFPLLAIAGGIASQVSGLPRVRLKSYRTFGASSLLPYVAITSVIALAATALLQLDFPLISTIAFALILFVLAYAARIWLLKLLLWVLTLQKPRTRVLIYGAGKTGLELASALRAHDSIRVVAFVDDDPAMAREKVAGLRIYPGHQIETAVRDHDAARVILAMPSVAMPDQIRIGRRLQMLGLEVQMLPSFAQLIGTEELVGKLTPLAPASFLGRNRLDEILPDGAETYHGRVVMVTGAGGSIGAEICRQLLDRQPRRLVLFEVSEIALFTAECSLRELASAGIDIVPVLGSITDARATQQAITDNRVEIVIHAAAYKHVPLVEHNPLAGLNNNVLGTRLLVDNCVRNGVERFILVSTDKAVRPVNVMGASKRLAEIVVQDMARRFPRTRFSIVRFGNVLGSSGSVIPIFKRQIERGGPVTLTHEDVTRYFMTISEAVRLVLLAGSFHEEASNGCADVFVLDMGEPVRIRQLAEQLIHAAGYTIRDEANPDGNIEIRLIGLRPGEKLHEELLVGEDMAKTPHPKIRRAAEESGLAPSASSVIHELSQLIATGNAAAARELAMRAASAGPVESEQAIKAIRIVSAS